MRVATTTEVVRLMGEVVRRADAQLVRSAARNAAHSVEAERVRRLDDARTARDLQAIRPAEPARGVSRR